MGFSAPSATSARRSTRPGDSSPRYVPSPGFLTLLTVCSLRAFRSRGSEPLLGFTLQSFPPAQSCAPLGADALMPFLTSRPSALRTRRSRCPAAPGRCSLRGSVPHPDKVRRRPILSWDSSLSRAFPLRRGDGFPPPSLMCFPCPPSGRRSTRHSRVLPNGLVDSPSRASQLS